MHNLILLALCFALGIALRRFKKLPDNATSVLSSFVIHISLPALTLLYIHDLQLNASLLIPLSMAYLFFGLASIFFYFIGRWMKLPPKTIGCLMLTGGLGNTAFVGLPMIESFYGTDAVVIGIIADQAGSFIVLSTFGIITAARYSASGISTKEIVKRIILFPPFIALLVAILLMPIPFPEWATFVLTRLGSTLAPMTLLIVGLELRLDHLKGKIPILTVGLFFKLILAPLTLLGFYVWIAGGSGQILQVTIFEAAMPPMIMGAILAMQYDLDRAMATLMIGIGIPVSFLTLPIWWWLLRGF
ncbi:AEC family transporter [bacterium]|nr:AEC family transporter [bacterium]